MTPNTVAMKLNTARELCRDLDLGSNRSKHFIINLPSEAIYVGGNYIHMQHTLGRGSRPASSLAFRTPPVQTPYATSTDSVRHQRKLSHPIGLRHQPAGWVGGGVVVVAPSAIPAAHFEPCTRYFCCYTQSFEL